MKPGKAFPSKDVLIKLADYLNCSVDYLLDRTTNPNIKANDKVENLIFRYNRLSEQNKNKLEGCLMILEQENN
jgi:transcriptional regulator with XRE-family HTH domain